MAQDTADARLRRTFAQWYCLLAGGTLLVAGVLGFIADGGFGTGGNPSGGDLIVFRVNGWHNLVHIGSGLVLLAAANTRPTAKTVAYVFGVLYGFVTLWGLIDGNDVFHAIAINGADNVLHVFLAAAAILCAWASPTTKNQQRARRANRRGVKQGVDAPATGGTVTGRVKAPAGSPNDAGVESGRFGERTTGERENLH